MASYKQVDHPNHKDVRTYVLDEDTIAGMAVSEPWATTAFTTQIDGQLPATSLVSGAVPTPTTSPSITSDCSKSVIPVSRPEAMFTHLSSPSEPTQRTKIIVGAVSAAAVITVLASMSLFCVYKRRRRSRSLMLTPPHSPLLRQNPDDKAIAKKTHKDISWVKVDFPQLAGASPRVSFDSGLGVIMGDEAEVAASVSGACRTNTQQHSAFKDQINAPVDAPKRTPGGPLSSNPPVGPAFGQPSQSHPEPRSIEAAATTIAERSEDSSPVSTMPAMGNGALTAKSSHESIDTAIQEMEPMAPRHRQLSPTKSILKKRSPSPTPPMTLLPPVPSVDPVVAEGSKSGKVSTLRKAMGSLVKPKKELKIVIAIEQPAEQPKKKRVSFGEDVVRRVSHSPETDEGDWQTIDTSSDDAGDKGEEVVALERQ